MQFNPAHSVLYGMTQQQLQAALVQAQAAYVALLTGNKPVTVSYAQGDGSKSVTYAKPEIGMLVALIEEIKAMLGIECRPRRPIRFFYR